MAFLKNESSTGINFDRGASIVYLIVLVIGMILFAMVVKVVVVAVVVLVHTVVF